MKTVKQKKSLISILSAVLGVVFALITGITYCATTLNLEYFSNPSSTSAYLGNQEYVMINDTLTKPVSYGEGIHNFEIAMQYSMSYDFDVRLRYTLSWSGGGDVGNVILNFANRDNIIYDEQYIYLADPVKAGNGKIAFITGVNFADCNDPNYYGKSLTITIEEKIYKAQTEYDTNHLLYLESSNASKVWLSHKPKTEDLEKVTNLNNAQILMYNYRRSFDYGIKYPGPESAYKKVNTTQNGNTTTTAATWLGGNKSYAGTAMYVSTGNKAISLTITVNGIWYDNNAEESDAVSENSIKYNYSSNWSHSSWIDNQLWEVRTFDYIIPANKTFYIDILDSIEITSANKNPNTIEFDKHRMVTNKIVVDTDSTEGGEVIFDYSDNNNSNFIKRAELSVDQSSNLTGNYSSKPVSIVNSSIYSNGLYEMKLTKEDAVQQTFTTSISLINNTGFTQSVQLNYDLYYHISNGNENLYDGTEEDNIADRNRAEKYVYDGTWTEEYALKNSGITYGYSKKSSRLITSPNATIIVAPYSCVSLVEQYSVSSDLQADLETKSGNINTYSDVWTFLDVSVKQSDGNDLISKVEDPSIVNLALETTTNNSTVSISVKNNSTSTISGIKISSFSVYELSKVTNDSYRVLTNKPSDWKASYWKYYSKDPSTGEFVQLKADTLGDAALPANTYYEKSQSYKTDSISLTLKDEFEQNATTITNKSDVDVVLKPGESIVVATVTTSQTHHVAVKGLAESTTVSKPEKPMIVNNGSSDAYIINNSENSYYLRFSGILTDETKFKVESITDDQGSNNMNYYVGIFRPGQIIKVSMTKAGDLLESDIIEVGAVFDEDDLSGWNSEYITLMSKYFALIKNGN